MSEVQYRNRTISQLVSELNSLGQQQVLLKPYNLIAIHDADIPNLRRYKNNNNNNQSQFFLVNGSQKKYYYSEVVNKIQPSLISSVALSNNQNFNVTIVMQSDVQNNNKQMHQFLEEYVQYKFSKASIAISQISYNSTTSQVKDQISKEIIANLKNLENCCKFYSNMQVGELFLENSQSNVLKIIRVRDTNVSKSAELKIIMLPESFFYSSNDSSTNLNKNTNQNKLDSTYTLIRSQLTQIFNYLKLNPQKRFEEFKKFLIKKHPLVDILCNCILFNSINYVLHWVSTSNQEIRQNRFEFYDKLYGISNLIKPAETLNISIIQISDKQPLNKSKSNHKNKSKESQSHTQNVPFQTQIKGKVKNDQLKSPINYLALSKNEEKSPAMIQLEYCRSLQRKTHKYSILNYEEDDEQMDEQVSKFDSGFTPISHKHQDKKQFNLQNVDKHQNIQVFNESQAISVLKAQHAVEVSQYHQTIQNLNRKLLVLTNQKGLEEMYTIHQREIMMLQLKIQELRENIAHLLKSENQKDQKSLKNIIRKQNQEIKRIENRQANQKIIHGKITMLQKQIKNIQEKLQQSQKARKLLNLQLETTTKRLKIRDNELEKIQINEIDKFGTQNIAFKEEEVLREVEVLMRAIREGKENSGDYLIRKVSNLLADLSQSRNLILQCNNFLMELQDHLESRLGEKDPEVVLDCNKFIRKYLIENLSII